MPQGTLGNAVVGQSGGPTAVINQSLVGVVEALQAAGKVDKILGAHHAVSGIVKDDYIDLTDAPKDLLDRIADTPSSALGSSRDKPDAEYCKRIFESFSKQDVRYFFYAGGNDSSDTCRIIAEMAAEQGYPLVAYHVPKTIDNDLPVNDHTPGFGSAAKFVAQAFTGDNLDNAALPGIKSIVVMGRHAGFLTAASMLGRRDGKNDGPHLIYVPEVTFDEGKFIDDVERVYKKHGRCLIAVSEGIHDASGNAMVTKLQENVEKDAHGNVQLSGTGALGDILADLVKDKLGQRLGEKLRVRADKWFLMHEAEQEYNPLNGLTFVPYDRAYALWHTCNHQVADWLRDLGCTVGIAHAQGRFLILPTRDTPPVRTASTSTQRFGYTTHRRRP